MVRAMFDLDAYFDRIRYAGPRSATRATLDGIVHAHVQAIPFENIDVLLGRGIVLDLDAIADKLVTRRRGGYCFEQNTLLLRVLTELGFDAHAISARVRIQRPRDFTPPRTHVFVHVVIDGAPWLADVGVGGLSPTAALRLVLDEEQTTPHETRRLIADGDWSGFGLRAPSARLFHQAKLGDVWADVCEFTLEPMAEIDRELGNWFTSTHPRSHFRDRLMAARATDDGRLTLLDREVTRRTAHGTTSTTIETPQALLAVLAADFGLVLPPETRFPHLEAQWSR
jgi:N-hydroxyarylamine O-acetyltransferase